MSSVSVIIPCYRYAQFLPECVASVLAQRDVDLRVLILDDASPDETPAAAAALAAADSRTEEVPEFAVMAGVPARFVRWRWPGVDH